MQSAAELIKEISALEIEVVHLERYLLSLYRTSFNQYLASSPNYSLQASRSPVDYHTRQLVCGSKGMLTDKQESHAADYSRMNNQIDCQSLEKEEMKEDDNCRNIEDSSASDIATSSDASSGPCLKEEPKYVCFLLYISTAYEFTS